MIFPQEWSEAAEERVEELPIPVDWALDFETGELAVKNGKNYRVEGLEAIKVWVYKALRTSRGVWPAYSSEFGHDLDMLIGSADVQAASELAEEYVRDALVYSPYIEEVRDVEVTREWDRLYLSCTVDTIYGEIETKTEVEL